MIRKEGFCQFFPKIFNFKVLWFFENENFVASTWQIRRLFGIELIKIYLIGSNVPIFENRQKVLNHSTLLPRQIFLQRIGPLCVYYFPGFCKYLRLRTIVMGGNHILWDSWFFLVIKYQGIQRKSIFSKIKSQLKKSELIILNGASNNDYSVEYQNLLRDFLIIF